ncbi:MAG TPA: MBL fold metallo-hydrolase [Thermoanaerobaculia bacterium]|nr:MBL fold metallo-hydrolase [Thermoanaerobaculia bacterium]
METLSLPTPFPVGPVNVHVILRDPLTLIDCGPLTEEAWDALGAGLKRFGLEVSDVKRVLITHGHQDHYGLAEKVADASGATLFGGRLDRRNFRQERTPRLLLDELARGGFGILARLAVMASVSGVDRFARPLEAWDELAGGETLPGDGWSVSVRSTPGHTPGSLTFEIPEAGVLFTGDSVLKEITPNAVVDEDPEEPGRPFRSVTRYFETLAQIGKTNAGSTLLTGHGAPVVDWAAHRKTLDRRYGLRVGQIERALGNGWATVRDLVAAIFPRVKTLNVFLAYSEVLGFLMYLEDAGRVEKRVEEARDRYRLVPAALL